jgi:hypothetical protein
VEGGVPHRRSRTDATPLALDEYDLVVHDQVREVRARGEDDVEAQPSAPEKDIVAYA